MCASNIVTSAHVRPTRPRLSYHLVIRRGPVDIQALQQLVRDDESLCLGVAGDTDSLPVLLAGLAPVSIPEAGVTLIQQVTHQLGQKSLRGHGKERENGLRGGHTVASVNMGSDRMK